MLKHQKDLLKSQSPLK